VRIAIIEIIVVLFVLETKTEVTKVSGSTAIYRNENGQFTSTRNGGKSTNIVSYNLEHYNRNLDSITILFR
jgi:hypothetical protein